MYAGKYAVERADVPAFIMAGSGEAVSYAKFDARTNRLAHLLRAQGLRRLDHYAIYMENNSRYLEACGAGERAGLYYTCVNSYLTADELAYIVQNSEAKVLITSAEKLAVAREALKACPNVRLCLVVGAGAAGGVREPWPCSEFDNGATRAAISARANDFFMRDAVGGTSPTAASAAG